VCAVRPNGFLSSKVFTLCRSEDRIRSFSTKNGLVFWSRLKFWRPTGPQNDPAASLDPYDYAEYGFSIVPEQGELIYLLCRGIGAKRVVDFATSVGMSALYFAAAMHDNGGGTVIGSELVPAKVATAKSNLADAGLSGYDRAA
jgi:hypothetical protein